MNRFKKAFNWYEKAVNKDISNNTHAHIDARGTFEELVKRATSKNIKWCKDYEDGYLMALSISCPTCEYDFTDEEQERQISYCPECGQALRWEADDE